MVAVITGTGLGQERGSGWILGSRGQLGSSTFGRYGEAVTVNAATGNLMINRTDEILIGLGQDRLAARAYNSLGSGYDDNGDNWRLTISRQITTVTGTVNTAGSTVTRIDWDGSDTLYTYDTSRSCYVGKQGTGAFDTLSYNSSTTNWTWTDGDTRLAETYNHATNPNNSGDTYFAVLASSQDTSGNSVSYSYGSNGQISQIASGSEYITLTWSGNNLTSETTTKSGGGTLKRVIYTYDASNRLETVTTDLSPDDSSVSDGNKVVTTYTYEGTSNRVASISQTGGAYLAITYDSTTHKVTSFAQTLASGVTATTSFSYSSGYTNVTDPLGNVTKLTYDSSGQLTRVDYPPAVSGATAEYVTYAYDSDGNVTSSTDGAGNTTVYQYDSNGNMTLSRSPAGSTVIWTYGTNNQVLTKTEYAVRDSDGSGPNQPGNPASSRYAYDSSNRLRYVVSPLGEVTEYKYNSNGTVSAAIVYRDNLYDVSSLAVTDPISESALNSWVSGIADKSTSQRTDNTYDFRGNLSTVTTYSTASTAGAGLTTAPYTVVTYTYDQFGNLLTRQTSGTANTETFVYDGLGRMTSAVDLNGATTTYAFTNSSNTTTITLASGLIETSTYDLAGRLITYQESHTGTGSSSSIASATTSYTYDKDGNLRMVTDAFGNNHYYFYDALNRRTAEVSPDGEITEYRYDAADRLQVTIRYATLVSSTNLASLAANPTTVALASIVPAQSTDSTNPDQWSWNVYFADGWLQETIDSDGGVTLFAFDGMNERTAVQSLANLLSPTTIASFKTAPPTTTQLPTTDLTKDDRDIYFYDGDGRKIGAFHLTSQSGGSSYGLVSRYIYDAAGELVETIQYTGTATFDASFATVLSSITAGSSDIHTRYFYDDQGHLKYTLDNQLHPTEYVYDNAGRVIRTIAYNGAIGTTSIYTLAYVAGQISTLSLAANSGTRTAWSVYDANTGNLAYTIDSQGDVVANTYDSYGRLIKQIAYAQQATSSNLSSLTATTSPTQANMVSWIGSYAGSSDRLSRIYYDEKGRVAYSVDPLGYVTHVTYDKAGRVLSTYRYPAAYSATDSTTLANLDTNYATPPTDTVQTTNVYDSDGRLSDSYDGLGIRTRYQYNALDRLVTKTEAYGTSDAAVTVYQYSSAGHLVSQTVASGTGAAATTSFTYDGNGRVLTKTDPDSHTTTYVYDNHGRLSSATDATGAVTSYLYDNFGNLLQTTDPLGNKTYAFYDTLNRVILTVDAEGYAVGTSYDAFGGIASVTRYATKITATITPGTLPTVTTNAADATTSFTYDKLGRAIASTDAEGFSDATTYNAFGNKASYTGKSNTASTGGTGGTTTYTYDKRGLLVSETLPTSSSVDSGATITNTFTYDARGNRTQMVEASGRSEARTTNYTYDKADNLLTTSVINVPVVSTDLSTTSTVTATVTNTYDSRGNVIKVVDANTNPTFFFYDAQDRKIAQINALGIMSKWTYDAAGNVTAQRVYGDTFTLPTTPGGSPPSTSSTNYRETTYTYDNDNRLLTTTVANARVWVNGQTGVPAASSSIVVTNHYDAFGNLTWQTDGNGNNVWYWYDKRGLKVAQVDQELYLTTYALDADGNVTAETRFANKLSAAPGTPPSTTVPSVTADTTHDRVTNFTYTKTGLRKTEQRTNVEIATVSAGAGDPSVSTGNATITYTYNGLGEVLTKQEATGDTTTYTYDTGGHQLTSTSASFTSSTGSTVSTAVAMTYDGLNNLKTSVENGARTTTYTYDAAGRVATMQDAAGFTRTYQYDANGNTLKVSYTRHKSDNSAVTEASATRYDALNRAVYSTVASLSGSTWTAGDITTMTYDAWGEITARAINSVTQESNSYDSTGRLYRSTAGDGTVKFYLYNANGNQTAAITSDGTTLAGGYSWSSISLDTLLGLLIPGSGYTLGGTAVAGTVTTITTYDKRGQATSTIEPGRQTAYSGSGYTTATITHSKTYNAFGEVATETDGRGNVTTYDYTTEGKVRLRTLPAVNYTDATGTAHTSVNPVERTYYDASGRVVATKDANGNVNKRVLLAGTGYGGADALTVTEYHADGGVFVSYYDANKDLVKKNVNGISGSGEVDETYTYDAMDRLLTETHPTRAAGTPGNATGADQTLVDTYAYDELGQRIKHHNNFILSSGTPIDEKTDYDLQGRVTQTIDMAGHTTSYSYSWSGSAATTGLGTFGGWTKTTTNVAGLTETETFDGFGRTIAKTDFGSHAYAYTFDLAGRQVSKRDTTSAFYSWGDGVYYTYFNTGLMSSMTSGYNNGGDSSDPYSDAEGFQMTSKYGYDADGNRTAESYYSYIVSSTLHWNGDEWIYLHSNKIQTLEDETAAWDGNNRITGITDNGIAPMSITYTYDLGGNIRRMQSTYHTFNDNGTVSSTTASEDYWYKYDAMNRFTTTMGTLSGGAISHGTTGSDIAYNYDGSRATMTDNTSAETYTYTADGLVAQVSIGGTVRATYAYDTLGRVTDYAEKNTSGTTVYHRYSIAYDNANNLTGDSTATTVSGTTTTQVSTYSYVGQGSYNTGTGHYNYDGAYQGIVSRVQTASTTGSTTTNSETQNWYQWNDGAQQSSSKYTPNITAPSTYYTSTYTYDTTGHLQQVVNTSGRQPTVNFITDSNGQVLKRDETEPSNTTKNPHEIHFYFNGIQVGDVSNNGTSQTDYAASIAAHTTASGNGPFRAGSNSSIQYANFDQSYSPINGNSYQSTSSSYTVASGDTLQSIAQQIWGDGAMWYLIADANGLSGAEDLPAGMTLTIPNKIANVHNTSQTFKPYDPNEAIGDTAPTRPKPNKNHCGVFGQILQAIVTVVTAYFLGPVLGDAVGQLFGMAIGNQKSFNWNELGESAISSFVPGASEGAGIFETIVEGAVQNAVSQGIGLALGLQKKFDWAGVAAAGIGAGVAKGVGDLLPGGAHTQMDSSLSTGKNVVSSFRAGFVNTAVSSMAGMLANAATRTLINGTDFGDNIIAALPSTIGGLVGSALPTGSGDGGNPIASTIGGFEHSLFGGIDDFFGTAGPSNTDIPDNSQAQAGKTMLKAKIPDMRLQPGDLVPYVPSLDGKLGESAAHTLISPADSELIFGSAPVKEPTTADLTKKFNAKMVELGATDNGDGTFTYKGDRYTLDPKYAVGQLTQVNGATLIGDSRSYGTLKEAVGFLNAKALMDDGNPYPDGRTNAQNGYSLLGGATASDGSGSTIYASGIFVGVNDSEVRSKEPEIYNGNSGTTPFFGVKQRDLLGFTIQHEYFHYLSYQASMKAGDSPPFGGTESDANTYAFYESGVTRPGDIAPIPLPHGLIIVAPKP
jgi:YD repeat-containing protein